MSSLFPRFTRPFWALVATILIWSLSPIALVGCFQLLPQAITASVAVLVATALSCLFFALKNRAVLRDALKLIAFRLEPKGQTKTQAYVYLYFLSITGFFLYPFFYVQAFIRAAGIATGSTPLVQAPVVVNIINYLWPCFAVFFGWLLLRERLTAQRGGGLLLALLGALLAVSSTTGVQAAVLNYLYGGSSTALLETGGVAFLVFALFGAIVWGLYTAVLPYCRFLSTPETEVHSASFFIALLIIAAVINIFYLGTQWESIVYFDYQLSFSKLGFFLLYSAGSLSTAHYLFAYVRRSGQIPLPAVAASTYFVFASGTVFLYIFTTPIITPPIAAGFALILTGAYLARDRFLISPLSGLIIFFFISYGMSAFFRPDPSAVEALSRENGFFMSFLEVLTGVFAIVSGFILSRAISRNFEQQQCFHGVMRAVSQIARSDLAQQAAQAQINVVVQAIERLYLSCVNRSDPSYSQQDEIWTDLEDKLMQLQGALIDTAPNKSTQVKKMIEDVRERIASWLSMRAQGASVYEWIVLGGLVTIMALVGYRITLTEPSFRIARAAFTASMIVIILAIGDYYSGRPAKSLEFLKSSLAFLPPQFRPVENDIASRLQTDLKTELFVVFAVALIGILSLFQIR